MNKAQRFLKKFVKEAAGGGVSGDTVAEAREIIYVDDPDSYEVFYTLMQDRVLPDHCRLEWVEPMYEAHSMALHTIIEAFRGGTKTTTIAETKQALRIGLNPEQSSLLIQADDTKARKHAKNAADMIAYNPMWKLLFPNIVPDEARGWGAEGYWVKDLTIDYGNWVRKRHQDPTLVGAGIFDSFITGMHPTGLLNLDDINNDKNTESERENERNPG